MPLRGQTHPVTNQSPPFGDLNLFIGDGPLRQAVDREGEGVAAGPLEEFGGLCGSAASLEQGRVANESPPRLRMFDARGHRLDVVEYHPAYHACMASSTTQGLHCSAWEPLSEGGIGGAAANVLRSAGTYMAIQMEAGHQCPVTMTNAAVPTLMLEPSLAQAWLPRIVTRDYDPTFVPAHRKRAVTIGMGMTEKQGGTDVRANTTIAASTGRVGPGEAYVLTGHKWFMSAPMSDAFLVLAHAPGGLSCFLMPRHLPDDTVNRLRFQRLKDKLGNRSNASAEVEFDEAHGWLIGEEGRGIQAIIEMVTCTRLDCAVGSAGLMRLALANAIHHCRHRRAFGSALADLPLMAGVLADMALDVEAAVALSFRLARSFDAYRRDEAMAAWRRVMTPVTKYWVCKTGPALAYEAMECLGGNGYVEEGLTARIYRELPVNAIWEGSGNVMVLDVLRVITRDRAALELVMDGLVAAATGDRLLEKEAESVRALLRDVGEVEHRGREMVERLAVLAAGTLLRKSAPSVVADAFVDTRLGERSRLRRTYGQAMHEADARAILLRAMPAG